MVGAGLAQQGVAQALAALALYELLQLRLVVAEQQRGAAGVQRGEYVPLYKAARGVHAAVEIERRDDGLHRVGEDGGALAAAGVLLAAAEADVAAQAQLRGDGVQALLTHQASPQPGHPALGHVGEAPEQRVRHHHAQNGVAQELQPLVALAAGGTALVCIGAVRQRGLQKPSVTEAVAEFFLKGFHQLPEACST